jgi:hypothetical protein
MEPLQHLQDLSSLDGYLQGYWLDESGIFISGGAGNDAGENMKKMMKKIFQLRKQTGGKEVIKKINQLIIHGKRKLVVHQFMGRPGNRVLLTSVLQSGTNLSKVKIRLYAIAEDHR